MPRIAPRLLLVAPCVLLVGLLALQVWTEGPVTRVDQHVTLWLAAHRQPWLTRAMLLVSAAHQTWRLLAVTALLVAWLAIRRSWHLMPWLGVVPAGMLLNVALKNFFLRPRPELHEPLVRLATLSFPSGHAVAATVFYGAVGALVFAHSRRRGVRAAACVLGGLVVLLVAFSRVYLGAHYLSDVVAGIAVGGVCLALVPPPPDAAAEPRPAAVPE